MILKAFWQHKIDIKRLFLGRNVSKCQNFRVNLTSIKVQNEEGGNGFLNNVQKKNCAFDSWGLP